MNYNNIKIKNQYNNANFSINQLILNFNRLKNNNSLISLLLIITIILILFISFLKLIFIRSNSSSFFSNSNSNDLNDIDNRVNLKTSYLLDNNSKFSNILNNYRINSNSLSSNKGITSPSDLDLREKLSFHFPYEPSKPLNNHIWQTWKVDITNPKFPANFKHFTKTWDTVNEGLGFNHYIIPDNVIDELITDLFTQVPEIIETWNLLPKKILKADFFRYLIVFARGGTYSDMDTLGLKPINNWSNFDSDTLLPLLKNQDSLKSFTDDELLNLIDPENLQTPVGLTIGIEADPDRADWNEWYARRIQFCQWTIQGKKGHPLLREVIIRIVEETKRKNSLGLLNKVESKDTGSDIMQWTGPAIFTDVVFDYLNNVLSDGKLGDGFGIGSKYWLKNKHFNLKKLIVDENGNQLFWNDQLINYKKFTGLTDPLLLDDVMILPITSFSPGVGQMGSQSESHDLAFVKHMFEGSWKPENERMP
ncbi:hypothetical protein B5S27_g864 [[Candida] boidinii]|nr:hypothetical protein B5S27_g864 [[Candida] boidinii]